MNSMGDVRKSASVVVNVTLNLKAWEVYKENTYLNYL